MWGCPECLQEGQLLNAAMLLLAWVGEQMAGFASQLRAAEHTAGLFFLGCTRWSPLRPID